MVNREDVPIFRVNTVLVIYCIDIHITFNNLKVMVPNLAKYQNTLTLVLLNKLRCHTHF